MKRGFTLLEILLAIMILSIMTIISTLVFHTIVHNWTLATEMADNMQRVDYITAQVAYALRSAYFLLTGTNPDPDAFTAVRGLDGWKEATFDMGGTPVRVAVASGLANTQALIEALKAGEVAYDFIEIMACPGGCAGGGGQPIHDGCEMADMRGQILWDMDKAMDVRFSHENPSIELVYKEYFGEPLSERAHHLLHTDHFGWEMPLAPGVKA